MAASLMAAVCTAHAAIKTVELLDDRTGMTIAALRQPLAFVETGIYDLLNPDKQPSFVYVGPVEWNRGGEYTYVLWVQVAPGVGGHRLDDIGAQDSLKVRLDNGTVALLPLKDPILVNSPYRPKEPVGQTAYFSVDVRLLKRMAASKQLALGVRAGDLTTVDFIPMQDTGAALRQFMADRGIAGD